jgi:glycine cleavage system regulatory protein
MTILGSDRPGLVESLSRVVVENGGNWIESRMAHLAGQFAGIVRVEVASDKADVLTEALRKLDRQGLELIIHSEESPAHSPRLTPRLVTIELIGQDRPGIVSEITRVLAAHGVNVEDLSTECVPAPTTGQPLFRAEAKLQLPSASAEAALRKDLERIAADLMVDLTIE